MVRCIANSLTTQNHDLVIASQLDMAGYVPFFRGLPAVFEEAELSTLYEQYTRSSSPWSRLRYGLTWLKHKRYLAYLLRGFRACTVVSEPERNLLTRSIPNYQHIETIPNCVNMELYDPVPKTSRPNSLIFTGSFRYDANYHAAQWFVSEIYPLIQVQIPEVRLTITGDHASLPLPSCTNLTLTGFVEDVKPLISSATVSVVPILEGGGTRLKILEAMALKTPVVTTTKGCEGLDICNTEHALIADTPAEFALAVIRLLKEPDLRDQLTRRAYGLVHSKYNWTSVMPRFVSFIEEVAKESSGMPSVLSKTQYLSTNPLK
jgi:glycosyltransferase involved in cell wall biosynthesis